MKPKSTNPHWAAQDILSRRDNSEFEMRQKLARQGFQAEEIEETITWLKEKKLINDAVLARRYTESIIRTKAVGRRYVSYKLKEKRISDEAIQEALAELMSEEVQKELAQKATETWQKQHKKHAQDKNRLRRFLMSRGF